MLICLIGQYVVEVGYVGWCIGVVFWFGNLWCVQLFVELDEEECIVFVKCCVDEVFVDVDDLVQCECGG